MADENKSGWWAGKNLNYYVEATFICQCREFGKKQMCRHIKEVKDSLNRFSGE